MLKFAQGRGLVAQNVALAVSIKDDGRGAKGPLREGVDFPSRAELKILMESASDRRRPLLVTAIFTGLRASELRGLVWSDVDLDAGIVHVRQRADAWGDIGPPKSKAGKRDIPLAPTVINTLRQWREVCPRGELGLTDASGKPRYDFHRLRHAVASLFIAYLGWTPKRIQTVMGHYDIRPVWSLV
jgi:integrase